MAGHWEHIHRLHKHCLVAMLFEIMQIASQGGWIAGHIDNPLRLHICKGFQHLLGASCPWRINHYHIRAHPLLVEPRHDIGTVTYDKLRIADVVFPGIFFCILYGRADNLHAVNLPRLLGQIEADGSRTAVGINNSFLTCQLGKLQCLIIEHLCLLGINLKEGTG